MASHVMSGITVTHPSSASGWNVGDINILSWTNASYTNTGIGRNYTIPDPFSFNFTLLPSACVGFCPTYIADYGPFTGTNGTARLDLSSAAQQGRYILQVYFFDDPSDTVVIIDDSDNFTIGAQLQDKPLQPFDEYNSSAKMAILSGWCILTAFVMITLLS